MRSVPVLEQYQQVKRAYPEAIVLFRLGDFFETFGEDARKAAPILGITLTSRELGKGNRMPMAGVPYHSYQSYVGKLLRAGLSVALCDQVEDSAPAGGLVRREVVRVLSPGMVLEDEYLDSRRSNFTVAICRKPHHIGLAALDCSTGELALTRTGPTLDELRSELDRLRPAELIACESYRSLLEAIDVPTRWVEATDFDARAARDRLQSLLGVDTLAAFGCEEWPEALAASEAVLRHASRAHLKIDAGLLRLHTQHPGTVMHLDPASRRSLGLGVSNADEDLVAFFKGEAETAMGARLLGSWLEGPLRQRDELENRLQAVEELFNEPLGREALGEALRGLGDLERLVGRAGQGIATPGDLGLLRRTLQGLPAVRKPLARFASLDLPNDPSIEDLLIDLQQALVDELPAHSRDGGIFRPGSDAELDAIKEGSKTAREWISGLEARERERSGIRSLRVGFNQVFGYYLEVSNANRELVPGDYLRKQTLVNAERYVTPDLKEHEATVLNAKGAMVARERQLFAELCSRIASQGKVLLSVAEALARIDALLAFARIASRHGWSRPSLKDEVGIEVHGGRHPLVEAALGAGRFVPNDLRLHPDDSQIVLLSGPNMAGKSTYLRQAALTVLLAQVGSFVPATRAVIGLCDRIFTRVGAHDELAKGLSTFMVEMVETAHILAHATPRSLLVLDEIGRGTSTYDGVSIAQALLEYLHDAPHLRSLTLFATHYHELTALAQKLPRMRNYRMEVREEGEKVIFLHQVVAGSADRSYGIHVAELAGLPRQVVVRARQVLFELEDKRPLEPHAAGADQLTLPLPHPVLQELKQLDLERLTPKDALDKLFTWQMEHALR